MERIFRNPLSKGIEQGARISRIGWLEMEIPDYKKREEDEGFSVPIPHLVIGSPRFRELEMLLRLMKSPKNITIRMSMEVKVNGVVHLRFYKKDTNQTKGTPITSFDLKPVMDSQDKIIRFMDYAKNSPKAFLDIQDTIGDVSRDDNGNSLTVNKVVRVSFEKEKYNEKERKFLYRKTDSIITNITKKEK